MHVDKFYPRRLQRSWAVMDSNGRPHSLWIYHSDAQEMENRLANLWPVPSTYRPLNPKQEGKNTVAPLSNLDTVIDDTAQVWQEAARVSTADNEPWKGEQ
jgi:hypothetical protein